MLVFPDVRRRILCVTMAGTLSVIPSGWATASLPPSIHLAQASHAAWTAPRDQELRDFLGTSSAACRAFVVSDVPPASDAWCRQSLSPRQRAIHAAPDLLLRAATTGSSGRLSGLGALHHFVNHADALALDGSGRPFRDEVFHIVGTGMHESIARGDAIDTMIKQLTSLCVRLEEAHSEFDGLMSPMGVLRESTSDCMLAAAVLEWERTGLPVRNFVVNASTERSNLTLENRIDMAQDHSLQKAGMLTHPSRTVDGSLHSNDGLRETSSLLTMQRYVAEMLQRCHRFMSRARERQCELP